MVHANVSQQYQAVIQAMSASLTFCKFTFKCLKFIAKSAHEKKVSANHWSQLLTYIIVLCN